MMVISGQGDDVMKPLVGYLIWLVTGMVLMATLNWIRNTSNNQQDKFNARAVFANTVVIIIGFIITNL